jgi:hypothetical protein
MIPHLKCKFQTNSGSEDVSYSDGERTWFVFCSLWKQGSTVTRMQKLQSHALIQVWVKLHAAKTIKQLL